MRKQGDVRTKQTPCVDFVEDEGLHLRQSELCRMLAQLVFYSPFSHIFPSSWNIHYLCHMRYFHTHAVLFMLWNQPFTLSWNWESSNSELEQELVNAGQLNIFGPKSVDNSLPITMFNEMAQPTFSTRHLVMTGNLFFICRKTSTLVPHCQSVRFSCNFSSRQLMLECMKQMLNMSG